MSIYDVVSDIRVLYLTEEMNNLKRIVKELNEKIENLETKMNEEKNENKTEEKEIKVEETNEKEEKKEKKIKTWPIVAISLLSGYVGLWFYKNVKK